MKLLHKDTKGFVYCTTMCTIMWQKFLPVLRSDKQNYITTKRTVYKAALKTRVRSDVKYGIQRKSIESQKDHTQEVTYILR